MFDYLDIPGTDCYLKIDPCTENFEDEYFNSYIPYDFAPVVEINGSWDSYLSTKSKKSLYNIKRDRRLIDDQFEIEFVVLNDWQSIKNAFPELLDLYTERWSGQSLRSPLLDKNLRRKFIEFTERLALGKQIEIVQLIINGELVAFSYAIKIASAYHMYIFVVSQNIKFKRFSLGKVFIYELLERVWQMGYSLFDFMLGDEPYKNYWATSRNQVYLHIRTKKTFLGPIVHSLNVLMAKAKSKFHNTKKIKRFVKSLIFFVSS